MLLGGETVKIEILPNADSVAKRAAAIIAENARNTVAKKSRFSLAVSGGKTPWVMLSDLANQDLPWDQVQIFQVDERVAPDGHPDRNLTHIYESLLEHAPIRPEQIHAMPVTAANLEQAAAQYTNTLRTFAGDPPTLDLAHLGMGPDGHTASLVPGDSVLNVHDRDVALTGEYQGRRRMTLTFPILNRSRQILWVITGAEKAGMLQRLRKADPSIPAGNINQENAIILADEAAGGTA
jgi:6-phosphogluconolactonase